MRTGTHQCGIRLPDIESKTKLSNKLEKIVCFLLLDSTIQ